MVFFVNFTECIYMKSLYSLLKERVSNGLTPYGEIFGFLNGCLLFSYALISNNSNINHKVLLP